MTRPIRLSQSPIIEAIVEVRHKGILPSSSVFAKLYNELSEDFPETETLPNLQVPNELKETQEQFKYSTHYRLKNNNSIVSIGENVISMNKLCLDQPYAGWDDFKTMIDKVMGKAIELNVFGVIDTLNVRYINYYDEKLANSLNLSINLFKADLGSYNSINLYVDKDIVGQDITLRMNIGSDATINAPGYSKRGTVTSIEAITKGEVKLDSMSDKFNSLHEAVEEAFFNSIKDSHLNSLGPEYV